MPTQDELLLKIIEEGSNSVVKGADNVADGLDKITKSQDKLASSADKSAKGFKGLTVGMADLKAGLDIVSNVGGKVVDFLKDSVESTVKYAAEVRDLSRAIGANAEESSALIQVADDVNVSVGTLEAAFKAAIKKGIQPSIENLSKLSDEYNAINDPVKRSQFAMEKFGRAGLDMAKLLEQGGDAIRSAAKEAKQFGLTLDDKAVQAARDFEIQLDNMGDRFEALKLKIGQAAVPALNSFFDTLSKGLDVVSMASTGFSATGDAVEMKFTAAITRSALVLGTESELVKKLSESLTNYLIIRQQVGLTEDEAGKRKNIQLAQEQAGTLALRMAQERMVVSGNAQLDAIMRNNQAILDEAAAVDRDRVAKEEADKTNAIYRAGVSETISRVDGLAQSLSKATDAQAKQMLAQAALDTIKKAQEAGIVSAEGAAKATDAVLLRYGLATEKSLALAQAQESVNQGLLDGKISLDDYVTSAEKLPQLAADGKVTLEELQTVGLKSTEELTKWNSDIMDSTTTTWKNVSENTKTTIQKTSQQMGQSLDLANAKLKDVDDLIKKFPDLKTVKLVIDVEVTGDQIPSGLPQARAYGGPVSAGMPYLVGERGPEIYVPRGDGYIMPNTTNYNNTTYNVTTDRTGLAYMFERQRQAEARM